MRQYVCAWSIWRTRLRSRVSPMATRAMGRSPEIPYAQSPDWPLRFSAIRSARRAQERIRDTAGGLPVAGIAARRRAGCAGAAARAGRRPRQNPSPGQSRGGRRTCSSGAQPVRARRRRPEPWRPGHAGRGAGVRLSRRLRIGSSTNPWLLPGFLHGSHRAGERSSPADEPAPVGFETQGFAGVIVLEREAVTDTQRAVHSSCREPPVGEERVLLPAPPRSG